MSVVAGGEKFQAMHKHYRKPRKLVDVQSIKKIEVNAGDVLWVKVPGPSRFQPMKPFAEAMGKAQESLKRIFQPKGVEVILTIAGVEIEVFAKGTIYKSNDLPNSNCPSSPSTQP